MIRSTTVPAPYADPDLPRLAAVAWAFAHLCAGVGIIAFLLVTTFGGNIVDVVAQRLRTR